MSACASEPWPCSGCGAVGVRNLGTRGYCAAHLSELYRTFAPESWGSIGVGIPTGPLTQDGWTDVECTLCRATWTGAAFMRCPWCIKALEQIVAEQRRTLLYPDFGAITDPAYEQLEDVDKAVWRTTRGIAGDPFIEWAHRLHRAVRSGIVTAAEAKTALRRQQRINAR